MFWVVVVVLRLHCHLKLTSASILQSSSVRLRNAVVREGTSQTWLPLTSPSQHPFPMSQPPPVSEDAPTLKVLASIPSYTRIQTDDKETA